MAAANSIARKAPDNETIAITAAAGQSIRLNSTPANPPTPIISPLRHQRHR